VVALEVFLGRLLCLQTWPFLIVRSVGFFFPVEKPPQQSSATTTTTTNTGGEQQVAWLARK